MRDRVQSQDRNPSRVEGSWTKFPAQYGEVRGHKFLYAQVVPVLWKSVQYLMEVPGSSVNIGALTTPWAVISGHILGVSGGP